MMNLCNLQAAQDVVYRFFYFNHAKKLVFSYVNFAPFMDPVKGFVIKQQGVKFGLHVGIVHIDIEQSLQRSR